MSLSYYNIDIIYIYIYISCIFIHQNLVRNPLNLAGGCWKKKTWKLMGSSQVKPSTERHHIETTYQRGFFQNQVTQKKISLKNGDVSWRFPQTFRVSFKTSFRTHASAARWLESGRWPTPNRPFGSTALPSPRSPPRIAPAGAVPR